MRCIEVSAARKPIFSEPGSPIHPVFSPELQADGSLKLVQIAVENTDEIIQSFYESTTLECILSRFMHGDTSALNRYQPIYADLSDAPHTLAEALQTVINSRKAFDALPVDIKKEFDSDFNKWLASAGSPSWLHAMDPVLSPFNDNNKKVEAAATADGGLQSEALKGE